MGSKYEPEGLQDDHGVGNEQKFKTLHIFCIFLLFSFFSSSNQALVEVVAIEATTGDVGFKQTLLCFKGSQDIEVGNHCFD